MKKYIIFVLFTLIISTYTYSQIVIPMPIAAIPEHGFLPGKKFKFYPTIENYNFSSLRIRMELFDTRSSLKNTNINCSNLELTNTSEFANPATLLKVSEYFNNLFRQSGATIDSTSSDTLQVWLEGIDARLIGFGYIRAHGLCQIRVKYHQINKTYCIDITDADRHSPISPLAFVTRLTATRIMASASIREVIELFFIDLTELRNQQKY